MGSINHRNLGALTLQLWVHRHLFDVGSSYNCSPCSHKNRGLAHSSDVGCVSSDKVTKVRTLDSLGVVCLLGLSENRENPYTQWFCWSLSLLFMAIIGGIPHFQTYPFVCWFLLFELRKLLEMLGVKQASGVFFQLEKIGKCVKRGLGLVLQSQLEWWHID